MRAASGAHHTAVIALRTFVSEHSVCAYLPDRPSRLEYSYVPELTPKDYEGLMLRGYRKFGPLVFRPVCRGCRECRPLRVRVADFRPNRSQRRAARRNADLTILYAPPTNDARRMGLYNAYHDWRAATRGWNREDGGPEGYRFSFLDNPLPSIEITAWEGDRLRAVVLTDITPAGVSGIYHYHCPEASDRGLGTFCMLQTIELARRLERPYAYFGYYVAGCGSLAYKARFRPCEILGEDGRWREFSDPPPD